MDLTISVPDDHVRILLSLHPTPADARMWVEARVLDAIRATTQNKVVERLASATPEVRATVLTELGL